MIIGYYYENIWIYSGIDDCEGFSGNYFTLNFSIRELKILSRLSMTDLNHFSVVSLENSCWIKYKLI